MRGSGKWKLFINLGLAIILQWPLNPKHAGPSLLDAVLKLDSSYGFKIYFPLPTPSKARKYDLGENR